MSALSPASLLFIDSRVQVPQEWLDAMAAGMTVVQISADHDALAQIAAVVQAQPGAKSVHIVSHGSPGVLQLGNSLLDAAALQQHADLLARIAALLDADAELLLYGCNVAAGEIGEDFIDLLAALTGASVAASDDATGDPINGGDWNLEKISGALAADMLRIQGLQGTLASVELSTSIDVPPLTDSDDAIFATDSGSLSAGDIIDGKDGNDTLFINAAHTVAFNATTLTNVENINIGASSTVNITTHDATVAAGETLTVNVSSFLATLRWDGSAETDGTFSIMGSSNSDTLYGGAGNDYFDGGAGNDILYGGAGRDTLQGLVGDDTLYGGAGADFMSGGAGNDVFWASEADAAGDYIFDFSPGDSIVVEGNSMAYLNLTPLNHVVDLPVTGIITLGVVPPGGYRFRAIHESGITTISQILPVALTVSADALTLTDSDNFVAADAANTFNANDSIMGSNGYDALVITATQGTVVFTDTTLVNFEDIRIEGGAQDFTSHDATVAAGQSLTVDASTSSDQLIWRGGNESDGNFVIRGGSAADSLIGGAGNDLLYGGEGNDTLYGGAGEDALSGGDGDDTLYVGEGFDMLWGGNGNDVFRGHEEDWSYDDVEDFAIGDRIIVEGITLTDLHLEPVPPWIDLTSVLTGYFNVSLHPSVDPDNVRLRAVLDDDATTISLMSVFDLTVAADTPLLTAGDNVVIAGSASTFNANDSISGSTGHDALLVTAAQNTVVFTGTTLVGFEEIVIKSGTQDFTSHDNTVAAGNTLTINADRSSDPLIWNGSAETDGKFLIRGSQVEDVLSGGAGDDLFYGSLGDDTLYGGAGNDTQWGGSGNDMLYGQDGNDTLYGDGGNDTIEGNAGDDELWGAAEDDVLYGHDGNDTLRGETGNDTLYGDVGNDTLYGQAGNDVLSGGAGADVLYGGDGNDTFTGSVADLSGDTIADFTSGDTIIITGIDLSDLDGVAASGTIDLDKSDTLTLTGLTAASGHFKASYAGGNTTLTLVSAVELTIADDSPALTAGDDIIYARIVDSLNATDTIDGGDGNDTLEISAAQTVVFGATTLTNVEKVVIKNGVQDITTHNGTVANGATLVVDATGSPSALRWVGSAELDGKFEITGSATHDVIIGGASNDTLYGGKGSDTLYGGGANDSLDGGDGNDTLYGGAGADVISGGSGNDLAVGEAGADTLYGDTGNDTIYGGADADVLYGGDDNDLLYGEAGADILYGGNGIDTLSGGDGNNTLSGGAGADFLYGGKNSDTYTGTLAELAGDYINAMDIGDQIIVKGADLTALDYTTTSSTLDLGGGNSITLDNLTATSGRFRATLSGGDTTIKWISPRTLTVANDNPPLTSGDDLILAKDANTLNPGDIISGGAGYDLLEISAAQSVVLGPNTLTNVEKILILGGVQEITTDDATVAAGTTLTIDASGSADSLTWNGSAETNGSFEITGGSAADTLIGGAGNDTIYGGGGADVISSGLGSDQLYGGAGNDTFSGSSADLDGDTIADFAIGDSIIITGEDLTALDGTTASSTLDLGGGQTLTLTSLSAASGTFTATLDSGNTVITLTPTPPAPTPTPAPAPAPEPTPTPAPTPTPTITTGIIDGVPVETIIDPFGRDTTITIGIVPDDREDVVGLPGHADIPVARDEADAVLLTLSIPPGLAVEVAGPVKVVSPGAAASSLQQDITDAALRSEISSFLGNLQPDSDVLVRTIVPTGDASLGATDPLIISGTGGHEALVIDASGLPPGTALQVDEIDFAVVIGAATVRGIGGNNYLVGDSADQFIAPGAGNDTLYGGEGRDTLGGLSGDDIAYGGTGDDILFGGSGHDTLVGGDGNDALNGGFGIDIAVFNGTRADYTFTTQGSSVLVTHVASGEVDRLTDIEQLHFADGERLLVAHNDIEAMAHHLVNTWLGRSLSTDEAMKVQDITQASRDDIVRLFKELFASDAQKQMTTDELLAGFDDDASIIRITEPRKHIAGGASNDTGYAPLGLGITIDGDAGHDVLRLAGSRADYHVEKNGNSLDITRLSDGAMVNLRNAELIHFDSGETTVLAHNATEALLGRLVQTFFDRSASPDEWLLGRDTLQEDVSLDGILIWFEARAGLEALDDAAYVQALYQQGLGRPAREAGLQQALEKIAQADFDRSWIAVDIAQSSEAVVAIGSVLQFDSWV
jgi:Ca2+-binding RTX toxin-like protein